MTLAKIAKALMWKTNIAFYRVTNFILQNSVDGFFRDVIFVGLASMMAVLSLALVAVGMWFFAGSIASLFKHLWGDFIGQLVVSLAIIAVAYALERGAGYVVLAEGDAEDDE